MRNRKTSTTLAPLPGGGGDDGAIWVLIWEEGGSRSGGPYMEMRVGLGWRSGLGGLPTSLVTLWQGEAQYSALLPTPYFCSELLRSGSWDFGLFVSCPLASSAQACRYFL